MFFYPPKHTTEYWVAPHYKLCWSSTMNQNFLELTNVLTSSTWKVRALKSLNNNTKTYHHKILIKFCPWYTLTISNNKHHSKIKDQTPHKVLSNLEVLHYLQHVQSRPLSNDMTLTCWFKTLQKLPSFFNIIDLKNLMHAIFCPLCIWNHVNLLFYIVPLMIDC